MGSLSARSDTRFTLDSNLLVHSLDRAEGSRHALAKRIVDRARRRLLADPSIVV